MAPVKGTHRKGRPSKVDATKKRKSSTERSSSKKRKPLDRSATEQKSKPIPATKRKYRREYTEEELNIPKLNTIVPAGVTKPQGKKKGKVFVDDKVSTQWEASFKASTH